MGELGVLWEFDCAKPRLAANTAEVRTAPILRFMCFPPSREAARFLSVSYYEK